MRRETRKTVGFVVAAATLVAVASLVEPESRAPAVLSDQGEAFYPGFKDPEAVKSIEVIDYDEATATARPFQVEFQRGRWLLTSSYNYPLDLGDRLVKTASALMDLHKDLARSDSPQDHAALGVVDPMDQKVTGLAGRGKRVTLRDDSKRVLADFILGKPAEGKPGHRYVRVPGQKRTYAVKTDADPSARFADWVNAGVLRIAASSIRAIGIVSYSIDERSGGLANMENVRLTHEGGQWKMAGAERLNQSAINSLTATLDNLKIVDVRPKPPSLAQGLKAGKFEVSLETAASLRRNGFFITPNGRLLASEGEMAVEIANGVVYVLRFGDIFSTTADTKPASAAGVNRYLFATASFDAARASKYGDTSGAGERQARDLNQRLADWYYVISGADFEKLRLRRKDLVR